MVVDLDQSTALRRSALFHPFPGLTWIPMPGRIVTSTYRLQAAGPLVISQGETFSMNDVSVKDLSHDPFEQMKLVYDYIKFHIGLYLATPPAFAIVSESFDVKQHLLFQIGLVLMIIVYVISGVHAGFFMGRFINSRWTPETLAVFNKEAYTPTRRNMHHTLYWIGLGFGVAGLVAAVVCKHTSEPSLTT